MLEDTASQCLSNSAFQVGNSPRLMVALQLSIQKPAVTSMPLPLLRSIWPVVPLGESIRQVREVCLGCRPHGLRCRRCNYLVSLLDALDVKSGVGTSLQWPGDISVSVGVFCHALLCSWRARVQLRHGQGQGCFSFSMCSRSRMSSSQSRTHGGPTMAVASSPFRFGPASGLHLQLPARIEAATTTC